MTNRPASEAPEPDSLDSASYLKRVLLMLAVIFFAIALWRVREAVLILFGSIVLAVILTRLASLVKRVTKLPRMVALWAVILVGLGLFTGLWFIFAPQLSGEFQRLSDSILQARETMSHHEWGRSIIQAFPSDLGSLQWGSIFSRATGVASSVFNFFTALFLLLFLTLFLAAKPGWYVRGIVNSFPPARRKRAGEVVHRLGEALWRWLIGQSVAMLAIALLSITGMFIVGMRFAILLGILAGLFQFIPFVGPVLWAVPATILAIGVGPAMAVKVLIIYTIIQLMEGHLITPIVQRHEANVPPVVMLLSTVITGLLFGPLGVILAAPMSVVGLVLYQMLYRQDTLGDDVAPLGNK